MTCFGFLINFFDFVFNIGGRKNGQCEFVAKELRILIFQILFPHSYKLDFHQGHNRNLCLSKIDECLTEKLWSPFVALELSMSEKAHNFSSFGSCRFRNWYRVLQ